MSQKNLTKPNIKPLTDKQLTAVNCLIGGLNVSETAVEVGVERETVSRWKNQNAAFIAAYNQARLDAHESYQVSLAELRSQALEFLTGVFDGTQKRIDNKTRANIALKLLAMGGPLPALQTDARDVQAELDRQKAVAGLMGMERLLAEGF